MRGVVVATLILASPGLGLAQGDPLLTEADAQREVTVLGRLGPVSRARLEALLQRAREAGLPTASIVDRLHNGQLRSMPGSDLLRDAEATLGRLELAGDEFRDAGRLNDPREVSLGATVLERGATPAQLGALLRSAGPARSLLVPLDVMARLASRGTDPEQALEQIGRQLAAGASDQLITALLTSTISKH